MGGMYVPAGAGGHGWRYLPAGGGGGGGGFTPMSAPAYSGSAWTSGELTFDDHFAIQPGLSGSPWNYGVTDFNTTDGHAYTPWAESGSAPYWGSSQTGNPQAGVLDYDFPGNVWAQSGSCNEALLGSASTGYLPQVWPSGNVGVGIRGHFVGSYSITDGYGPQNFTWSSGLLNSYNNAWGPSAGHTECIWQVKAQQMGYGGSNNGAWNAIWFLGQGLETREIDLQETGLSGQSPDLVTSHFQSPAVEINPGGTGYNVGVDLSAGMHIYAMELLSSYQVNIYLDNNLVGSGNVGDAGPYFLILSGCIANGNYGNPPTTNVDMDFKIEEVQLYQR